MAVRILYVATVTKQHIMQFHIPFLKMCKEAGWETAVAARNDYANPNDCNIPYCDVYYDIPFERSPFKAKNIVAYRELKKLINEGNFDIIHCHTPVGAMLTRLAARKARKKGAKIIYTAHGFHFYKGAPLKNWLMYYPVERILARLTDVLITINKEDYACAQTFKAGKVVYVPGVGIEIEKYQMSSGRAQRNKVRAEINVPENALLIISVGELNKNKNHSVVIRSLAKLENKNIHFCVAGEGKYRKRLRVLAQKLNVSDRVHLLGYRQDIPALFKASDVFCLPSLREGLPVALMEAMASGLPCLASRIRGNVDLMGESSEMLFDPRNLGEFKRKLEQVIAGIDYPPQIDYSNMLLPFSQDAVLAQMKEVYGIIK